MALWSDTAVTNLNWECMLCLCFVLGEAQFSVCCHRVYVCREQFVPQLTQGHATAVGHPWHIPRVYQMPRGALFWSCNAEKIFYYEFSVEAKGPLAVTLLLQNSPPKKTNCFHISNVCSLVFNRRQASPT